MITEAASSTEAGGTGVVLCYATLHYTTVHSTKPLPGEEEGSYRRCPAMVGPLTPAHELLGLSLWPRFWWKQSSLCWGGGQRCCQA